MQILLGGALLDPKCQLQDGYTSTHFIGGVLPDQNGHCRTGTLPFLWQEGGNHVYLGGGGDFLGTGKGVASQ